MRMKSLGVPLGLPRTSFTLTIKLERKTLKSRDTSVTVTIIILQLFKIQTMSAKWRHRDRDGYHSDEYSDDDYTDQDDYTDCDDSGSEYDDEWLVYDNSGGDSGSEYSWEDTIYLNDNIRSWHTRYSYQRSSYGANRRTNDRAASMPPISYGRAKSEREKFTSPRNRRAATCEPRLLFAPTPGAKSSVAKGREFEDYFKMGVERARGNITSKVEFQKKLNVTPGRGDKRRSCRPDAVFTKGRKGAIVEMKNYERTRLGREQIDKTYNDMCALKDSMRCSQVSGYMYVRQRTKVNQSVVDYARRKNISIMKEGEVDADELAELVDRSLKI